MARVIAARARLLFMVGLLLLAVAACAPRSSVTDPQLASELQRTALNAYHRMEIAFLEDGVYTTNALIDLRLPSGVKWTLQEFSGDDYLLRFTSDNQPSVTWLVSPAGVMAESAGAH